MKLEGRAHKFSDNMNTDYIISGKYKFKTLDMKELSKHLMEDIEPEFLKKIKSGDFLVAGKNFGCGSSREQAPLVIKEAALSGVVAKSFARIFYRNAINTGLLVIEADTDGISTNDELLIDLHEGFILNKTKDTKIMIKPLPNFIIEILSCGGLVEYLKKNKEFKIY